MSDPTVSVGEKNRQLYSFLSNLGKPRNEARNLQEAVEKLGKELDKTR